MHTFIYKFAKKANNRREGLNQRNNTEWLLRTKNKCGLFIYVNSVYCPYKKKYYGEKRTC
jgi:hypothetical protein